MAKHGMNVDVDGQSFFPGRGGVLLMECAEVIDI